MIKKQRFIICVLVLVAVVAMLTALVACEVVVYVPEEGTDPPVNDVEVPMPLEYKLYVQAYGAIPVGTPIGSVVPEYYVFTEGATISSALNYVKDGYDFAGWYTDAEFNNTLASHVMPNRDLYVYAKWTENTNVEPPVEPTTVKISFKVDTIPGIGQSADIAPLTGRAGEKIKSQALIDMPVPTFHGYVFVGWYYNDAFSEAFVLTDDTVFSDWDITLYARWEKQYFMVNYNTNGGSNVPSEKLATGSQVSRPETPIKHGCDFIGWFMKDVNESGQEVEVAVNFETLVVQDKNIEIYAKWQEKSYTIRFDATTANGEIEPLVAKVGEDISSKVPTPTRLGYEFIAWYESKTVSGSSTPFDFTSMPAYDVTLYAHWSIKDHELTVSISNGDMVGTLYPEGDLAYEPVYTILKVKATANTEHTDFKSLSFVISITELKINLANGTSETLSNASDISKILHFSYSTDELIKDELTDVKIDFKLDKNTPIKYAGATFEIKIKLYTSAIVDANGNDVDADDIKTTVDIA